MYAPSCALPMPAACCRAAVAGAAMVDLWSRVLALGGMHMTVANLQCLLPVPVPSWLGGSHSLSQLNFAAVTFVASSPSRNLPATCRNVPEARLLNGMRQRMRQELSRKFHQVPRCPAMLCGWRQRRRHRTTPYGQMISSGWTASVTFG